MIANRYWQNLFHNKFVNTLLNARNKEVVHRVKLNLKLAFYNGL